MRYILITILALSLPAMALGSNAYKETNGGQKVGQNIKKVEKKSEEMRLKIQKKAQKGCNPVRESTLPWFY